MSRFRMAFTSALIIAFLWLPIPAAKAQPQREACWRFRPLSSFGRRGRLTNQMNLRFKIGLERQYLVQFVPTGCEPDEVCRNVVQQAVGCGIEGDFSMIAVKYLELAE